MKKIFLFAAAGLLLASCASDEIVDNTGGGYTGKMGPINFTTNQKNITRGVKDLNETGHYNFGVFAYKITEPVNNIMENYLVGYMDETNKKGYYMTIANQTTLGDAAGLENGQSHWQYERMGNTEYDYVGEEGYYKSSETDYMSNIDKQYLRYWDKAAATTTFYAYAPYINGDATKTASFDNSSKILSIPDGSIVAGYDDPTNCEYMYAVNQVAAADYGKDVPLQFQRLNAKVNVKFWEDIEGYSVRILTLKEGTYNDGVYAKPAKVKNAGEVHDYDVTDLYIKEGVAINFSDLAAISVSPVLSDADKSSDCLTFVAPVDAEIGTTRLMASSSATTYYAVPQPSASETGLTFHVSYELTSTTGEKIIVKNATCHVPVANVKWEPNKHYTYIFKITANANGSTAADPTIDPDDPDVPAEPALYPIIFDNCTVVDYEEVESDHTITDVTNKVNYSVVLDKYEVDAKVATPGTVTATLKEDGAAVASPAGSWSLTGPTTSYTGVTFTGSVATVAQNATAGKYTITYTPTADEHAPATSYSADFYVIGKNALTVSTTEVGTGGVDATTLTVTATVNGASATPTTEDLTIEYPDGLTAEQKNKVKFTAVAPLSTIQVEKDAKPGTYKVKYHTAEGDAYATFEVKNYGLTLDKYLIKHNNTDQTITATAADGEVSLGGTYSGVSLSGNTITVAKTTAEGTYTVKSTVTKNTSVTVYEKTFTVQNDYVLTLDKTLVDNDEDTNITVTSKINGAESTAITITPADSKIAYDSATKKITVSVGAATGTYTVQLKDGTNVVKEATFIVQD